MALHGTPASMLWESLDETFEAAKFCSDYRKSDIKWGDFKGEGCLGYPAGVLLFSIIDSIGSYYRKDKTMTIKVDNKVTTITSEGWQHFKILNSKYFNQTLSETFLKALYSKFRSVLTHNSVLGDNAFMIPDNNAIRDVKINGLAFLQFKDEQNIDIYFISIAELLALCKTAIEEFKKDIDVVVPNSKVGRKFN